MFDPVAGTVEPIEEYDEADMVASWFSSEKSEDLVGKKWDPENDAEYMRQAIRGWGRFILMAFASLCQITGSLHKTSMTNADIQNLATETTKVK